MWIELHPLVHIFGMHFACCRLDCPLHQANGSSAASLIRSAQHATGEPCCNSKDRDGSTIMRHWALAALNLPHHFLHGASVEPQTNMQTNVNPGLINPWLINRGVSPFSGDSDDFWREHPPNSGTGQQ